MQIFANFRQKLDHLLRCRQIKRIYFFAINDVTWFYRTKRTNFNKLNSLYFCKSDLQKLERDENFCKRQHMNNLRGSAIITPPLSQPPISVCFCFQLSSLPVVLSLLSFYSVVVLKRDRSFVWVISW